MNTKCDVCKDWDAEFLVKDIPSRKVVPTCSGCLSKAVQEALSKSSASSVLISEA